MVTKKSILVTRPSGQADSLIERLSSIGYLVSHQPMLEIKEVENISITQSNVLSRFNSLNHIIFISSNAVRFGLPHILSQCLSRKQSANYYAVGSATASLLMGAGIEPIFPKDQMTSEGILALPSLREISGHKVALIKGVGGRDKLGITLEERGAKVISLDCYRRIAPKISSSQLIETLENQKIDIAIFSSGESVKNFLSLIRASDKFSSRITLLVASNRIAKIARLAGWNQALLVSDSATDDAIIKALIHWHKSLEVKS